MSPRSLTILATNDSSINAVAFGLLLNEGLGIFLMTDGSHSFQEGLG